MYVASLNPTNTRIVPNLRRSRNAIIQFRSFHRLPIGQIPVEEDNAAKDMEEEETHLRFAWEFNFIWVGKAIKYRFVWLSTRFSRIRNSLISFYMIIVFFISVRIIDSYIEVVS